MIKAYKNFLRVEIPDSKWVTEASVDILSGKVLSVGSEVKDIKEGDTVEFQYSHSKRMSTVDGVIYYVKDEAIMGYENNNNK